MYDNTLLNKTIQVKTKTKTKTKLDMTAKFGRIMQNKAMPPFRRSRSFKVTDFGTNRKLIYGFLYQDDS